MQQTLQTPVSSSSVSPLAPDKALRGRDTTSLMSLIVKATFFAALLFLVVVIILPFIGAIQDWTNVWALVGVNLGLIVSCGLSYLMLLRKRGLSSVRIYSIGLLLSFTAAGFVYGATTGPAVIGYLVPITVAGLLGGRHDVWWVLGGASISYAATMLLQTWNAEAFAPLLDVANPLLSLIVFLGSSAVLAYISWYTSRELTFALTESHHQATDLMERTEQLMEKSIQQVELGSELSAAATQLQATSQQQASGATEQASAVSEVSTTVEELGATARQIAQATEHVAQAAQQTLGNLSQGQAAVDENIQSMERIRERMKDISRRVLELGERSQQIGEIIDLIDDISDETHLLALNAAIEAAGAGEHGRRFGVVAAEVKNLANRTLAAAKEVKEVIVEIRQATNAAVLAAEEGGKEVEQGADLSYRAGQVMDTILMMAERTAQSASEIGMATAQQQSASEQVVEAMREIAEVARQSASGSRQMAESSTMLSAIADRLHGINQTERLD